MGRLPIINRFILHIKELGFNITLSEIPGWLDIKTVGGSNVVSLKEEIVIKSLMTPESFAELLVDAWKNINQHEMEVQNGREQDAVCNTML